MKVIEIFSHIWMSILSIAVIIYGIIKLSFILRDQVMNSNKTTSLYIKLRMIFWKYAFIQERKYIFKYCDKFIRSNGEILCCLMLYELESIEYKLIFIKCGPNKLRVSVITKLENIKRFIYEWKEVNSLLTTEEILILYINEVKLKQTV